MKKGLVLLLLMVYGLSTIGATLNFQYCCGKLDRINSIPVKSKSCCSKAAKKQMKNKGCCKDKHFSLKIKSEHAPATYFVSPSISLPAIKTELEDISFIPSKISILTPEVFAPPPKQKNFTILFCNFRI